MARPYSTRRVYPRGPRPPYLWWIWGSADLLAAPSPLAEYGGPDFAIVVRGGTGVVGCWNLAWQMGWVVNSTPSWLVVGERD
jgi:hypothetical protein